MLFCESIAWQCTHRKFLPVWVVSALSVSFCLPIWVFVNKIFWTVWKMPSRFDFPFRKLILLLIPLKCRPRAEKLKLQSSYNFFYSIFSAHHRLLASWDVQLGNPSKNTSSCQFKKKKKHVIVRWRSSFLKDPKRS